MGESTCTPNTCKNKPYWCQPANGVSLAKSQSGFSVITLVKSALLFQVLDHTCHQVRYQARCLLAKSVGKHPFTDQLVPGQVYTRTDRVGLILRRRRAGRDSKRTVKAFCVQDIPADHQLRLLLVWEYLPIAAAAGYGLRRCSPACGRSPCLLHPTPLIWTRPIFAWTC